MDKTEQLLKDGVITQHPELEDKVIFNIPSTIPKAAVEYGAFELFAKEYGWSPEVLDPSKGVIPEPDKDGNLPYIPNPQSAIERGIEVIRKFATDVLQSALLKEGERQGRQAAQQQFNSLNI